MYHVTPFRYLIEAIIGQVLGGRKITCSPVELVPIVPPAGQTCGEYLQTFISNAGSGYVVDPSATGQCAFCSTRTADEFISRWNIRYDQRWRDFGIVMAYIVFNVSPSSIAR